MIKKDVGREGGMDVGTEDGRELRACSGSRGVRWGFVACLLPDC